MRSFFLVVCAGLVAGQGGRSYPQGPGYGGGPKAPTYPQGPEYGGPQAPTYPQAVNNKPVYSGPSESYPSGPAEAYRPAAPNHMNYMGGYSGPSQGMYQGRKLHSLEELYEGLTSHEAQIIAKLFAWRQYIKRNVKNTYYGADTTTESDHPEVADWIIQHCYQMRDAIKNRQLGVRKYSEDDWALDKARDGANERVWSDLYPTQYGMYVEHHGDNECAVKAVQTHAEGVTRFLAHNGFTWALQNNPAPKECHPLLYGAKGGSGGKYGKYDKDSYRGGGGHGKYDNDSYEGGGYKGGDYRGGPGGGYKGGYRGKGGKY